jgi:hypothetical protein
LILIVEDNEKNLKTFSDQIREFCERAPRRE